MLFIFLRYKSKNLIMFKQPYFFAFRVSIP